MPDEPTPPADWQKSRIGAVSNARDLLSDRLSADRNASLDRAALINLFGGEPPFDPGVLRELGRSKDVNLNMGQGGLHLEERESDHVDMISGGQVLFRVETGWGTLAQRAMVEAELSIELSKTVTDWDGWVPNMLTLGHQYVWFGVGLTYFPNELDWRFGASGLGKFLVSRGGRAIEGDLDMVFELSSIPIPDLVKMIGDYRMAKQNGWDLDAVREVLSKVGVEAPTVDGARWEEWALKMRSNDIGSSRGRALRVDLVHAYIPEWDGTRSHFIFDRANGGYLYQRVGRFAKATDLFTIYVDTVGTDDFHAVRGLAHKLFEREQINNACWSDFFTSLRSAMKPSFQATNESSMMDFGIFSTGDANVIPPGFKYIERTTPNFAESALPVLNTLAGMQGIAMNTGRQRNVQAPQGSPGGSPAFQMALNGPGGGLNSAQKVRFMAAHRRHLTAMVRRMGNPNITASDPGGAAIYDLRLRLEEKGIPFDAVRMIRRVYPVTGMSAQAMLAQAQALGGMSGSFDEEGRRRALYFQAAAVVGWDQARLFVPETPIPRISIDQQLAAVENHFLKKGEDCPVLPGQDHLAHATMHTQLAVELLRADEMKAIPEQELFAGFQMCYKHIMEHVQVLAGDPDSKEEVQGIVEALGPVKNRISQIGQHLQAAAMEAQRQNGGMPGQPGAQPGQPDQGALKLQQMQAEHELRMQQMQAEAAAAIEIIMMKAKAHEQAKAQALATKAAASDAITAAKVGELATLTAAKAHALPPTPPPAPQLVPTPVPFSEPSAE